jgi:hypothetical protein
MKLAHHCMEGLASKGLSGAAPVLEGYGLSCEHDLSLLVQEDLNALSSQLTQFHSRILRTWVQGLAAADQHHKRDKKRAAGDVNDAPAAKKHSNAPPSAEIKEQEGTKHIAKEDGDEDEKEEDEDKDDTGDEDEDEDEDEDSILVEYWRNFEWFGRGLNRLFGRFLQ